jgi:predicted nuclease of predicted toxin-antitoxin system
VKFLVDNQLPLALARALKEKGFDCEHVFELGMDQTADANIWRYAISKDRVVISRDEDFVILANSSPHIGQLIWIRLGNCRNEILIAAFSRKLDEIITALEIGGNIIELR